MVKQFINGPETQRLKHRAFAIRDADVFYQLNSDPVVMRYTGESLISSVEEAQSAIENYPDFKTIGYGRWACLLKETESIVGFCGLKYLPDLDQVDVGYRLLPQYWGQGLATEACAASLEFGFKTLGLNQIIGIVLPENIASIRVLQKSGLQFDKEFDYEGTRVFQFAIRRG